MAREHPKTTERLAPLRAAVAKNKATGTTTITTTTTITRTPLPTLSSDTYRVNKTTGDKSTLNERSKGHKDGTQKQETTVIDHPNARGYIDENGQFRCECGARPITNSTHHIGSHLSTKHNEKSMRVQKKADNPRVCAACMKLCQSFFIFESHIRRIHQFRGSTASVWNDWRTTEHGDTINIPIHSQQ
ncbi:hypothetical protein F4819DRAFT_493273 [Hypoxylon fuscum]|nr:hypothetical protein F4819DRAFT_493273 [Hypoxylon fuscum]